MPVLKGINMAVSPVRSMTVAVALAAILWVRPLALAAQTCPMASPAGAPVSASQNHRYFEISGWGQLQGTVPLLGMSYEYLCHVLIPTSNTLATQYCQLANYQTIFRQLANASNNVVRINAIFNSSPGVSLGNGVPFADEEVFSIDSSMGPQGSGDWDLSRVDQSYLQNLEMVVCTAYTLGLVVEVTLFDPWNPNWTASPFNPANTVRCQGNTVCQGFTAQQFFASFDTPASKTDSIAQNHTTRSYQTTAVGKIVDQLKKYPNIIWQIANEPDFIPVTGSPPAPIVAVANVMDWENYIVSTVLQHDRQHMIMINGHQAASFAWNVVPSTESASTIQTAHYPYNETNPPTEGAIAINNDDSLGGYRASWELAFDENQSVPNVDFNSERNADDVRSEAWEFVMGGGGLFNAYSYSIAPAGCNVAAPTPTTCPSIAASQQLHYLWDILYYPVPQGLGPDYVGSLPVINLSAMELTACNQSGSWCSLQQYGTIDEGQCPGQNQKIYFSAISSASANLIYIHHSLLLSVLFPGTKHDGYHEVQCLGGYQTSVQFNVTTPGCWWITWVEPKSGMNLAQTLQSFEAGVYTLPSPPFYDDDVAVVVSYASALSSPPGACAIFK
jgi:hypothetical protein